MEWNNKDNQLIKKFTFDNFRQAFAFMTEVALIAEKHDHHPNWENEYNWVIIRFTTHSENNTVTEKDWELANAIDSIYE